MSAEASAEPSIRDLLAPDIVAMGGGRCEIRFPVRAELTIPGGVVQGGIVAAMLDMAMAMAAEGAISTASLQVDILRPALGPELLVEGRVERRGRRIVFADAEMRDGEGRLVARGRQTAVPTQTPA